MWRYCKKTSGNVAKIKFKKYIKSVEMWSVCLFIHKKEEACFQRCKKPKQKQWQCEEFGESVWLGDRGSDCESVS